MRILLPITLDRWRNPIATLLRACVEQNPDIEFHSASGPFGEEDRVLGEVFWSRPNIHRASQVELATTRFDGVHTASVTAHNQAAAVAAKLRNPGKCQYLATVNLQVGPGDGKDWTLLKIAEKLADGFISVSQVAGEGVAQRCPDRFLGVIPNGFDPEYFDPSIEDDDCLPALIRDLEPGSFPLYVGALEPRKHPEFVVELARKHSEITFVGAGYVHPEGRHFEPLVKSVKNLIWLGHVDRRVIRALMRRAGVFVFPSEREGLPLSVIEALGMGLKVIGQPKTSMPELIQNGVNGWLIDLAEREVWSEALVAALGPVHSTRLAEGRVIREAAKEQFAWAAIGRRYGRLYRQMFNC